jgi:hypothetical protein
MYHRASLGTITLAMAIALLTPGLLYAQPLSTYDSFSSEQIDPGRWTGIQHALRYGSPAGGWSNEIESEWTYHPEFSIVNTSVDRRVVGGQLRLQLSTRGGTHDNTMAPGHGRFALRSKAGAMRVQSRVTVTAADAQPCRSTGESRARAQVYTELTRDTESQPLLFATLSLERSSFGGDRIVAVLSRCRDSGCRIAEDLDWVVFDRTWAVGSVHTLTITHQPANERVVFSVGGGGVAAESRTLGYPAPPEDSTPSGLFALQVENSPSNCPADGGSPAERVVVTIDARFDNVRTSEPAQ